LAIIQVASALTLLFTGGEQTLQKQRVIELAEKYAIEPCNSLLEGFGEHSCY
jgi:hypothetical protein